MGRNKKVKVKKRKLLDLTGKKFGKLVVVDEADGFINSKGFRVRAWNCVCDCGNNKVVRQSSLRSKSTRSCGCLVGKSFKPNSGSLYGMLLKRLSSIKYMCYNKASKKNEAYTLNNITICEEWLNDFNSFYKWAIKKGYNGKNDIAMINIKKGYSPSNCKLVSTRDSFKQEVYIGNYNINE